MSRPPRGRVPRLLAISPPSIQALDPWIDGAAARVQAGVDGMLLRILDGCPTPAQRAALVDLGVPVLLHQRTGLAPDLHLPGTADPAEFRADVPGLLGMSCHDAAELARSARGGCDYALLSPVFPAGSKPGDLRPALGLRAFGRLCAQAGLPVLALGGIGPATARACREAGAWGLAGISAFEDPDSCARIARAWAEGSQARTSG